MVPSRSYQHLAPLLRLPLSRRSCASSFGSRLLSTSTSTSNNDGNSHHLDAKVGEYMTGTVLWYDRSNRLYGFVVPDKFRKEEIFVQRKEILSPLDFEASPKNPYLRKGDRIRFKLQPAAVRGRTNDPSTKPVATEITLENGRLVPPLRETFLSSKRRFLEKELGSYVYAILDETNNDKNNGIHDNEDPEISPAQLERIKDAWKIVKSKNEQAVALIRRVGMRVEDFPMDYTSNDKTE